MENNNINHYTSNGKHDQELCEHLKTDNMVSEPLILPERYSSLAIEPSHVFNEITITQLNDCNETKILAFQSSKNFIIGVLLLLLMITCNCMIGPLSLKIPNDTVYLKAVWRTQTVCIISIILMVVHYVAYGYTLKDVIKDHSGMTLINHAISGFFLCFWNLCFIIGCSKTITSHATILYSSSGVYLMAFSIVTCKTLHKLELIGYGIYLCGAFLMLSDPEASKKGGDGPSYLGDFISFLGAGAGAFSGYFCSKNSKVCHPFVTMANSFIFSSMTQLIVIPLIFGSESFYSFDVEKGAFGWASNPFIILLLFCFISPITGILGNIGYFFAFTYFPVQVIVGFMLIEPFFGQIVGIFLGQDNIPGILTWIGGVIVTTGFIMSIVGEKLKSNKNTQKKKQDTAMQELNQIVSESSKTY